MLNLKWIRENPEACAEALAKRGMADAAGTVGSLLALDAERRSHVTSLQGLQEARNVAAKGIGQAVAAGDHELASRLKAEAAAAKQAVQEGEERQRELDVRLADRLAVLPNVPYGEVPEGSDESGNLELRTYGAPPVIGFEAKEHFELGEALRQMHFEAAAKVAGSRFTVLQGGLARLERALGQFMLDLHTKEHLYVEMSPPLLVRDEAMHGTGQLPKFAEDLFRTTDGRWLIPTAEVSLTNLVREMELDEADLPLRMVALTPCFRSEAGAAGRDQRGMLRQHQFNKVELVSVTSPEAARAEHERMTACAEEVLKRLGLHFRTMLLCAGDMGFSARKTYDIEVWLPGQGRYREISSCSDCGDFQARRMEARFRDKAGKGFVHTLNGSGVAVGRALIAVVENYQNEDGSVTVPEALLPYMGGLETISAT